jgi:hypothetical protein
MPPAPFALAYFSDRVLFLPRVALDNDLLTSTSCTAGITNMHDHMQLVFRDTGFFFFGHAGLEP